MQKLFIVIKVVNKDGNFMYDTLRYIARRDHLSTTDSIKRTCFCDNGVYCLSMYFTKNRVGLKSDKSIGKLFMCGFFHNRC